MLSGMYSAEQTLRDSDFIPRLQEEKTTNRKVGSLLDEQLHEEQ